MIFCLAAFALQRGQTDVWAMQLSDPRIHNSRYRLVGSISGSILIGHGAPILDADTAAWIVHGSVEKHGRTQEVVRTPSVAKVLAASHGSKVQLAIDREIRPFAKAADKLHNYDQSFLRLLEQTKAGVARSRQARNEDLRELAPGLVVQQVLFKFGAQALAQLPLGKPQLIFRSDIGPTDVPKFGLSIDWADFRHAISLAKATYSDTLTGRGGDDLSYWNIKQFSDWQNDISNMLVWAVRDTSRIQVYCVATDSFGEFSGAFRTFVYLLNEETHDIGKPPTWFMPEIGGPYDAPIRYLGKEWIHPTSREADSLLAKLAPALKQSTLFGDTVSWLLTGREWIGIAAPELLWDLAKVWPDRNSCWTAWERWMEWKEFGGRIVFRPRDPIGAEFLSTAFGSEAAIWNKVAKQQGRSGYERISEAVDAGAQSGFDHPLTDLVKLFAKSQSGMGDTTYDPSIACVVFPGKQRQVALDRYILDLEFRYSK